MGNTLLKKCYHNTGNDRFSGNDSFSGTKTPDNAILFTVSGITAIEEQKFRKFRFFLKILMRYI